MANIGNIYGTIGVNTSNLKAGLTDATRQFATFSAKTELGIKKVVSSFLNLKTILVSSFGAIAIKNILGGSVSFQNELGKVASLVDDTSIVFTKFKSEIEKLSISFGESTSSLTAGLFDIISATIPTSEAMETLAASTKLAKGGFTTTNVATQAVITAMQIYKGELKDATDATDFLFAVQKRGRLTVEDVARTFGGIASSAKSAKISVETLGAAISAISRTGVGAETSVVELLALINSFSDASKEAQAVAMKFGVEMNNTAIEGIKLFETIEKLKDATAEEIAVLFSNIRAQKGFNALVSQRKELMRDLEATTKRANSTQEAYDKSTELAKTNIERFSQSIRFLLTQLGDEFLPILTEATKRMSDFILKAKEGGTIKTVFEDTTLAIKTMNDTLATTLIFMDLIEKKSKTLERIVNILVALNPFITIATKDTDIVTKTLWNSIDAIIKGLKDVDALGSKAQKTLKSVFDTAASGVALTEQTKNVFNESGSSGTKRIVDQMRESSFANKRKKEYEENLRMIEEIQKKGVSQLYIDEWEAFEERRSEITMKEVDFRISQMNKEFDNYKRLFVDQKASVVDQRISIEELEKLRTQAEEKIRREASNTSTFIEELSRQAARMSHQAWDDIFFKTMKNDWEDLGDFMRSTWDAVLRSISSALATWVNSSLNPILNDIASKFNNIASNIGKAFAGLFGGGGASSFSFAGMSGGTGGVASGLSGSGATPTLAGLGGSGLSGTTLPSVFNAMGNAFKSGRIVPMADGSLVNQPTYFPMAGNNIGLMGEAGAEAVMPLTRTRSGKLGVMSDEKESKPPVNVTVILDNIVDPKAFGKTDEEIVSVVVQDYAKGGSLKQVIRKNSGG